MRVAILDHPSKQTPIKVWILALQQGRVTEQTIELVRNPDSEFFQWSFFVFEIHYDCSLLMRPLEANSVHGWPW